MEREILFRGKRIDNGEWVEGNYSVMLSGRVTIQPIGRIITYEVLPTTVGQFTGLTDKNGKKIFEGDIIEYKEKIKNKILHDICVVKYDYCLFSPLDCYATNHIEVIGNIHDNPELLKDDDILSEKFKEFYEKKKAITERLRKDNEDFQKNNESFIVCSRWEISSDGYYPYCKRCKARPENGKMTKYCSNCGAKMNDD